MNEMIKLVQTERVASGLSIRRLAAFCGCSFSTLARLERGIGQPDPVTRIKLEKWLSVRQGSERRPRIPSWMTRVDTRLDALESHTGCSSGVLPVTVSKSDSTQGG